MTRSRVFCCFLCRNEMCWSKIQTESESRPHKGFPQRGRKAASFMEAGCQPELGISIPGFICRTKPLRTKTCCELMTKLGGAFTGEKVILLGSKFSRWKEMITLFDVGSFLKISRIVNKSRPHGVAVFSTLPNPPKCRTGGNILVWDWLIP